MPRRLEALLALLLAGAAAIAWTWPLVLRWDASMAGSLGDPMLLAWTLEWDAHAIGQGLPLWDANIFHPSRLALVFSDHLLGQAPFFMAGKALGMSTAGAYNLTFLCMVALNAFAAWLLARHVCGSPWVALVAGAVYAFAPWRLAHVDHLVFLSTAGYPLALLFWLRSLEEDVVPGRRAVDAGAATLCFAWQALCGGYHSVYIAMLAPALAVAVLLRTRDLQAAARGLFPGAAGLLLTLPALWPYLEMKRTIGHLSGAHPDWGAGLLSLFLSPSADLAWGWTSRTLGATISPETLLFPGLVALALAWMGTRHVRAGAEPPADAPSRPGWGLRLLGGLIALLLAWAAFIQITGGGVYHVGPIVIRARGTSAPVSMLIVLVVLRVALDRSLRQGIARRLAGAPLAYTALAVMAVLGVVLSFYAPTALLGRVVPGLASLRVPARAFLLALLPLAVLAARGAAAIIEHRGIAGGRAAALSVLLAGLALGEGLGIPLPVGSPLDAQDRVPRPAALAGAPGDAYRWLAGLPAGTPVAELPLGTPALDLGYQLASTLHWQPLVNGSSGYSPRWYAGLAECLQRFPSKASLEALQALGTKAVVVHLDLLEAADRERVLSTASTEPRLRQEARFGETVAFWLADAPAAAGPAGKPALPAGPEIPRTGWSVEASVEPGPMRTAARMLDGDFRTRWATERPQQTGDSVTLDMGRVETVGSLSLELGSHASDYPRALRVEASLDGQAWHAVGRHIQEAPPLRACLARPLDPWVEIAVEPSPARWLRLVLEADAPAFWCVAELKVHRPANSTQGGSGTGGHQGGP